MSFNDSRSFNDIGKMHQDRERWDLESATCQEVESVEGLTKLPEKFSEDPVVTAKLTLEAQRREVIKFGEMGIDLQKERHETRLRLKRALTDTYRGRASKQVVRSQGFERSGENNTITLQWLEYWMERVKVNTSHKTHTMTSLDETLFNCWAAMSSVNDLQVSPCQG